MLAFLLGKPEESKSYTKVTQKEHNEAFAGSQDAKEHASSLIFLETIDSKRVRWMSLTNEQWASDQELGRDTTKSLVARKSVGKVCILV